MKRACVFLVADKTMAAVFKTFLSRDQFHQSLGCGAFSFDPTQDIVTDEAGHDPGVYCRAHLLLEPYQRSHTYAVVVLDTAWEGSPGATVIAAEIENNLGNRWKDFVVIVIDPELEAWIWQDSQHVEKAFHYKGPPSLREWLQHLGDWPPDLSKPSAPKATVEKVLRHTRTPRSAAVYQNVVKRISVANCTDGAFRKLTEQLQTWFPVEAP